MNAKSQVACSSILLSIVIWCYWDQKHEAKSLLKAGITNDNGHFYAVHPVLESTDIFYYGNVPMTNDGSHIYPIAK